MLFRTFVSGLFLIFYFMFVYVAAPTINELLGLVQIKERNNELSELSKSDNPSEKQVSLFNEPFFKNAVKKIKSTKK